MTERTYPWSREMWALLLDQLFAAGARVVVFDLVFNPPNEGDPAFRAALERYRDRVVIGSNFDRAQGSQHVVPNATLIPPPQAVDDRVGYVNFWPDATDGRLREIRFTISERQLANLEPFPGEEIFHSLSARALAKFSDADVPPDQRAYPFRFGPAGAYQPRSLYEVFLPATWRANYNDGAFFKDKLVIVGASAQIFQDKVDTPLGPSTPGPAVHLHAMAAAMAREFLAYTSPPLAYALVAGAGGAGVVRCRIDPPTAAGAVVAGRDYDRVPRGRTGSLRYARIFPADRAGAERVSGERVALARLRLLA